MLCKLHSRSMENRGTKPTIPVQAPHSLSYIATTGDVGIHSFFEIIMIQYASRYLESLSDEIDQSLY